MPRATKYCALLLIFALPCATLSDNGSLQGNSQRSMPDQPTFVPKNTTPSGTDFEFIFGKNTKQGWKAPSRPAARLRCWCTEARGRGDLISIFKFATIP